jgi:hypothetical protein
VQSTNIFDRAMRKARSLKPLAADERQELSQDWPLLEQPPGGGDRRLELIREPT